jgi:hypothetical protein
MTAKNRKRIYIAISIASFIAGWFVNYHRIFIWEIAPNDALFISQFVSLIAAILGRRIEGKEKKRKRQ